jgi:hypothetical protein
VIKSCHKLLISSSILYRQKEKAKMKTKKMVILMLLVAVICGISQVKAFPGGCDCQASGGGCRTYANCEEEFTGAVSFCKDDTSAEGCSGEPTWWDPDCDVDDDHTCETKWERYCVNGELTGSPTNTGLPCGGTAPQCSW